MKFRLNPKRPNLTYAYRCETKAGSEVIVFDKANPEHEIPAEAVKRLLELNRGPDADILPVKGDEAKVEETLDLPTKAEVKDWNKSDLADLAKQMGLTGYESLTRSALRKRVQDALPREKKPLPKEKEK